MNLLVMSCLAVIIAYLLGSINSAVLVSRLLRQDDIRKKGSGNAGTTNIWIAYGRTAGILTAVGDLAKAIAAVLIARLLIGYTDVGLPFDPGYLAGLFVLIGHVFPLFFSFKGGKAVMPAVGVILIVDPIAFAILVTVAFVAFFTSRKMSVVSLTCALILPVVTIVIRLIEHSQFLYPLGFTLIYTIIVIVAHRQNIHRLLEGQERTIPKSR